MYASTCDNHGASLFIVYHCHTSRARTSGTLRYDDVTICRLTWILYGLKLAVLHALDLLAKALKDWFWASACAGFSGQVGSTRFIFQPAKETQAIAFETPTYMMPITPYMSGIQRSLTRFRLIRSICRYYRSSMFSFFDRV